MDIPQLDPPPPPSPTPPPPPPPPPQHTHTHTHTHTHWLLSDFCFSNFTTKRSQISAHYLILGWIYFNLRILIMSHVLNRVSKVLHRTKHDKVTESELEISDTNWFKIEKCIIADRWPCIPLESLSLWQASIHRLPGFAVRSTATAPQTNGVGRKRACCSHNMYSLGDTPLKVVVSMLNRYIGHFCMANLTWNKSSWAFFYIFKCVSNAVPSKSTHIT